MDKQRTDATSPEYRKTIEVGTKRHLASTRETPLENIRHIMPQNFANPPFIINYSFEVTRVRVISQLPVARCRFPRCGSAPKAKNGCLRR